MMWRFRYDLHITEMDGYTLSRDHAAGIPGGTHIVMIFGSCMPEAQRKFAEGYLDKPFFRRRCCYIGGSR